MAPKFSHLRVEFPGLSDFKTTDKLRLELSGSTFETNNFGVRMEMGKMGTSLSMDTNIPHVRASSMNFYCLVGIPSLRI